MLSHARYAVRHTDPVESQLTRSAYTRQLVLQGRGNNMSAIRTAANKVALTAVAAFTIVVGAIAGPVATANAADDSCANVEVVFARGTFEAPGVGATGQAFVDALNARMPGRNIDAYGVNYPPPWTSARPLTVSPTPPTASSPSPPAAPPPRSSSVATPRRGRGRLQHHEQRPGRIRPARRHQRPDARLGRLPRRRGRPVRYPEPLRAQRRRPRSAGHQHRRRLRRQDHPAVCPGDPICGGGMDRSAHSAYKFNGMANQAADFVARQLGAPAAPAAPIVQTSDDTAN